MLLPWRTTGNRLPRFLSWGAALWEYHLHNAPYIPEDFSEWLHVADIDGDDIMDLVATGRDAHDIIWYKNSGGTPITWTPNTIDANLDWPSAVDVVDIDLDSDLDLFATVYEAEERVPERRLAA